MPAAWGVGMTRHPKLGAVERRALGWLPHGPPVRKTAASL